MPNSPNTEEAVRAMSRFVNSYTPELQEFIKAMGREHRTLQQTFTGLCLKWLEHCASNGYSFDDRNAASHNVSKELIVPFKISHDGIEPSKLLPFI